MRSGEPPGLMAKGSETVSRAVPAPSRPGPPARVASGDAMFPSFPPVVRSSRRVQASIVAQWPAWLCFVAWLLVGAGLAGDPASRPSPLYEYRVASADGTGKFFCGREIAHVMGHQGAEWLERPERATEERPDLVLEALKLRPGDVVADIGAGTGYYSWRMAKAVGPQGRVLAVDIQQEMLDQLVPRMAARGVTNVVPVLGTIADPKLPKNGVDLVLMVDVYHEFSHPYEMIEAIGRALKPWGRLVFVEFRGEDPAVPIKPLHKMTEAQVRREAGVHPLVWTETVRTLPWQHLVVFRRAPDSESQRGSPGAGGAGEAPSK